MALNFPDNPSNGDPYTAENGVTYVYNASIDAWTGSSAAGDNYWSEDVGGNVYLTDTDAELYVGTDTGLENIKYKGNPVNAYVQAQSEGNTYSGQSIISYTSADYDPVLTLGVSNSNTPGTNTLVGALWDLGKVQFVGNDGTDFQTAAVIDAYTDGTPAAGSMPGALRFSTSPDGSVLPVERLKIDSSGVATFSGTIAANTFNIGALDPLPAQPE